MRTLWLALLLLATNYLSAQSLLLSPGEDDVVLQGADIELFCDSLSSYSINDIRLQHQSLFKPAEKGAYNQNRNAVYWVRFELGRDLGNTNNYLLECEAVHTDSFTLFIEENGSIKQVKNGEGSPYNTRSIKIKNLVFDLPMPLEGKPYVFYLKAQSAGYSNFNFHVRSYPFILQYMTIEYYVLGAYYGILFILAVYNLILFFFVREKVYLLYVLYVAFGALSTMADDGLGFQLVWGHWPAYIRPFTYHILPILLLLSFLLYSSSFLELRVRYKNLFRVVWGSAALYFIYFITALLFTGGAEPMAYTLPFFLTYAVAIYLARKGSKPALFFAFGYSFIILSILVLQLRAAHILSGNIFTVYAVNVAYILEALIFSYSLSYRFRLLKEEKEKTQEALIQKLEENKVLQEKVNRELEEKVQARTSELQEKNVALEGANGKLAELNEQINAMNARLDYDNYYLKKDIKENMQARVMDEEVDYEGFTRIFPDEGSCMSFLEQKKWSEHYACRKCGNPKYNTVQESLSRKCTRCGNIESVMAYTLFHGVKFPVHKAFYITYLVYKKGDAVTSSELSTLLDLRKNTCWSFKKKVMERVDEVSKGKKVKGNSRWENLIFANGK